MGWNDAEFCDRIRLLREEPHSQKLAEAAVGLGTDNGTLKKKEGSLGEDAMQE